MVLNRGLQSQSSATNNEHESIGNVGPLAGCTLLYGGSLVQDEDTTLSDAALVRRYVFVRS